MDSLLEEILGQGTSAAVEAEAEQARAGAAARRAEEALLCELLAPAPAPLSVRASYASLLAYAARRAGATEDEAARVAEMVVAVAEKRGLMTKAVLGDAGRLLAHTVGPFLDAPVFREVLEGRVEVDALLEGRLAQADPRGEIRRALLQALGAALAALPALAADGATLRARALALERGAYNAVILYCQTHDHSTLRAWSSATFCSYYAERCAVLVRALRPGTSVTARYGLGFARAVIGGEVDAEVAGGMLAIQITPQAYALEVGVVNERKKQAVQEKTSALWVCPNCKARECTYREVQDRSADEPASIYCLCVKCRTSFQAA